MDENELVKSLLTVTHNTNDRLTFRQLEERMKDNAIYMSRAQLKAILYNMGVCYNIKANPSGVRAWSFQGVRFTL